MKVIAMRMSVLLCIVFSIGPSLLDPDTLPLDTTPCQGHGRRLAQIRAGTWKDTMPKVSLFEVVTVVPTSQTHALDAYLQEIGAQRVMMRPYRNGATAPPAKKKQVVVRDRPGGNVGKGQAQQEWVLANVPKGAVDITALHQAWADAGFAPERLAPTLRRAVALKVLKSTGRGSYRRIK